MNLFEINQRKLPLMKKKDIYGLILGLLVMIFAVQACDRSSITGPATAGDQALSATPTSVIRNTEAPTATPTNPPTQTATSVPSQTPVPILSLLFPEFSQDFQPVVFQNHTAEIFDMQIPIDIGVTPRMTVRKQYPIKGFQLAEDIIPVLGELWLKACHTRFTHFMEGNPDLSFEAYLDLVKQGQGHIEMAVFNEGVSSSLKEVMSIDPRAGLAITMVEEKLPLDHLGLYLGSDREGKLVTAVQVDTQRVQSFMNDYASYNDDVVWSAIFTEAYQNIITAMVSINNDCLIGITAKKFGLLIDIPAKCSPEVLTLPDNWDEMLADLSLEMDKLIQGQREPILWVVE
jgi:hypothetical protein